MPRRARRIAGSGIYHVMLRGVNRDSIFLEDEDFERFLAALARAKEASGCQVFAYCLMTNHVHLVVRALEEPIGLVVKRLGVRYSGWFNRKYGRVGHLFQDRFRSEPVEDDAYLVTLLRYVWNNPVEAGLVERPENYRWSSRRLLGQESALVDGHDLQTLLPVDALGGVAAPAYRPETATRKGRRPLHTDEESADLLRRTCGARCPEEFQLLEPGAQRGAVRDLRTRSVSAAQIARVTGLSTSRVRRMQVSSTPLPAEAGPPASQGEPE